MKYPPAFETKAQIDSLVFAEALKQWEKTAGQGYHRKLHDRHTILHWRKKRTAWLLPGCSRKLLISAKRREIEVGKSLIY